MKMFTLIALLTFAMNAMASSQVQVEATFAKITGEAAKEIYDSLNIPALEDLEGEAGPDILFKDGKSFRCFKSISTNYYACDIFLN